MEVYFHVECLLSKPWQQLAATWYLSSSQSLYTSQECIASLPCSVIFGMTNCRPPEIPVNVGTRALSLTLHDSAANISEAQTLWVGLQHAPWARLSVSVQNFGMEQVRHMAYGPPLVHIGQCPMSTALSLQSLRLEPNAAFPTPFFKTEVLEPSHTM